MIIGICMIVRLTITCASEPYLPLLLLLADESPDIEVLPLPATSQCTFLKDPFCAEFNKDPLTIVTTSWAALQLTWTFMLLFVHLTQIARNITTYETMRNQSHAGPLMTAITTGTTSAADAQLDGASASVGGHGHNHGAKNKEGCLGQWSRLLGIDTFITVAFQGYKGSRSKTERIRQRKSNPWTRGVFNNCQDFWMDGPVFKRKAEGTRALLGGDVVDYARVYELPGEGGMAYRRGGYEAVPAAEEGEA